MMMIAHGLAELCLCGTEQKVAHFVYHYHLLMTTLLGQDISHLALQLAWLNLVKMTLAGWKQQQVEVGVVSDLVEILVDLVEVLVEDVAVLDLVGQVVVKHRKKMMNYCPQKSLKTS